MVEKEKVTTSKVEREKNEVNIIITESDKYGKYVHTN
jgi:hypothetical protein